ncbi:MAG: hypothetical protein K2P93_03865 [Alphaproteobacteria bacterium]|nr:hypothetical protein [Alphaproteobacteria bacterium]
MALCEWEKNKVWIWRAIDGVSRRPLGWELGHRGDASAKKLISRIDTGTCSFVTDEWGGFFRLLPEERHFYGKDLTFPIEGTNSDIRHRLARFHRRSKTTSRNSEMVEASLLLFHHLQSPEALDSLLKPILSFFN